MKMSDLGRKMVACGIHLGRTVGHERVGLHQSPKDFAQLGGLCFHQSLHHVHELLFRSSLNVAVFALGELLEFAKLAAALKNAPGIGWCGENRAGRVPVSGQRTHLCGVTCSP